MNHEGDAAPRVVDAEADARFRELARGRGWDPDTTWVCGYVEYEWNHARHLFQAVLGDLAGVAVLEFGCNVGASSVVLRALGAEVAGVDVDAGLVEMARLNARRHGLDASIRFSPVPDGGALPFDPGSFDVVVCNSVLEYVPPARLPGVQRELDRVLRPGGRVLVMGTSNRLWPREVHSGNWFGNWLPRLFDRLLKKPPQRGVFPWRVTRGFRGYRNLDRADGGQAYLAAQRRMGRGALGLALLRTANTLLRPLGATAGLLTPNLTVTLEKPPAATARPLP